MTFFLLILSLILIPLCTQFSFLPILPDAIVDVKSCKLFLAIMFALIIAIIEINRRGIARQNNKWPAILVAFVALHQFLVPHLAADDKKDQLLIDLLGYLPLVYVFIYYLFFLALQNICNTLKAQSLIAKTLAWVGFICAIYLILQFFGLDDRQILNNAPNTSSTDGARMFSFLGHPNFAGTFIALCVPFAIYQREYLKLMVMAISVGLSESLFPATALCIGLMFYLWHKTGESGKTLMSILIIFIICILVPNFIDGQVPFPSDSGRFPVWLAMWEDIKQAPLFGYGFGSFAVIFNTRHHFVVPFQSAHNEFWQFIYGCGFVGGMIYLSTANSILSSTIKRVNKSEILLAYTSSFAIILLCSLGQFVWQVEPTRYISIIIISIISIITSKEAGR